MQIADIKSLHMSFYSVGCLQIIHRLCKGQHTRPLVQAGIYAKRAPSAGQTGKARLYRDTHTASCCLIGPSKMHFMDPCVPMDSCAGNHHHHAFSGGAEACAAVGAPTPVSSQWLSVS